MKPDADPLRPSLLATLLDQIPEGFYALDREWRYTYVNRAAAELVERRPAPSPVSSPCPPASALTGKRLPLP